jgi:hypothetical protein
MSAISPRQNVEIALRGGYAGYLPFTIYECMLEQSELERELRNRGLCIVNRMTPAYKTIMPNVKITSFNYSENGSNFTRTYYETPVGTATTLMEAGRMTSWYHEKLFKTEEDYKIIKFMAQDEKIETCYELFAEAEKRAGNDIIFRASLGLEPIQSFISGIIMDAAVFCLEWFDNRDEILQIAAIIRQNRINAACAVADSPASHVNYGGNVITSIISKEIFDNYYVPSYDECADILHAKGKLIGSHFDGDCGLIADSIAKTKLDYIEAFTPAPDTDMTLEKARTVWDNKVLWLNFPSSLHLKNDEEIEQITLNMFGNLANHNGLIVGITEDMPYERHLYSCRAIMNGLEKIR